MEDSICIPNQTFRELIQELQAFVKLLDRKMQDVERHRNTALSYRYDLLYLQELLEQKMSVLRKIEQVLREAILTSSQKVTL